MFSFCTAVAWPECIRCPNFHSHNEFMLYKILQADGMHVRINGDVSRVQL